MEYYIVDGELRHHGTKGMKWGVRRYQNKDGSLTAMGRMRYGANKAAEGVKKAVKGAVENHRAKRANEKEAKRISKLMKKPISKLTESELAERTAIANKQKQLRQIESDSNKLANSAQSFMSKFGGKMLNEAIVPAAVNAGKQALEKFLTKKVSDMLGLNKEDTSNALDALKSVGGDYDKLTDAQAKALGDREKNINTAKQNRQQHERIGGGNNDNNGGSDNKGGKGGNNKQPKSTDHNTGNYEQTGGPKSKRFKDAFSSGRLEEPKYQGKHESFKESKLITTKVGSLPELPAPDLSADQVIALFGSKKKKKD